MLFRSIQIHSLDHVGITILIRPPVRLSHPYAAVFSLVCQIPSYNFDKTYQVLLVSDYTPVKGYMATATQSAAGYMDADVKDYLKRHFKGNILRDFDVVDFIEHIWGLDVSFLSKKGSESEFKLKKLLVIKFVEGMWERSGARVEGEAAVVLQELWENVQSQLPKRSPNFLHFLNMKDRTVHGTYAKYKPDFVTSPLEDVDDAQSWEFLHDCAELKKKELTLEMNKYKLRVTVAELRQVSMSAFHLSRLLTNSMIGSQ